MGSRVLPVVLAGLSLVAGGVVTSGVPAGAASSDPCGGFPGSLKNAYSGYGGTGYSDLGPFFAYPENDTPFAKPGDRLYIETLPELRGLPLTWRRDGVPIPGADSDYVVTTADAGHWIDVVLTGPSGQISGNPATCDWTSPSLPVGTTPTKTSLTVNRSSYEYGDGSSVVATVKATTSSPFPADGRVVVYRVWYDNNYSTTRHSPIATFRNDDKPHQVRLWATYGRDEALARFPERPALEARFVPDDPIAFQYSRADIALTLRPRAPHVKLALKKRVVARKSRAVARVRLDLAIGPRTTGKVVLKSRGKVIGSRKVSANGRTTVTVRTKRLYDRGRRTIRAYWVPTTADQKISARGHSVKRVIRVR